jgi:hypothetical protein
MEHPSPTTTQISCINPAKRCITRRYLVSCLNPLLKTGKLCIYTLTRHQNSIILGDVIPLAIIFLNWHKFPNSVAGKAEYRFLMIMQSWFIFYC